MPNDSAITAVRPIPRVTGIEIIDVSEAFNVNQNRLNAKLAEATAAVIEDPSNFGRISTLASTSGAVQTYHTAESNIIKQKKDTAIALLNNLR